MLFTSRVLLRCNENEECEILLHFFLYTLQLGLSACPRCKFAQGVIQKVSAKYSSEAKAFLQNKCEGNYPHASLQRVQRLKVSFAGHSWPKGRSACGGAVPCPALLYLDAKQSSHV